MNEVKKLEEALRASAERVFRDDQAQEHLEDRVLEAFMETQRPLSAQAQRHLAECTECRSVVAALLEARVKEAPNVLPFQRLQRIAVPLLAVAATALYVVIDRPTEPEVNPNPAPYQGTRGEKSKLQSEVTALATLSGQRRDIRSGDTMRLSERLGFKYGNPRSEVQTLTVLGWDGSKIHWYYPKSPDEAPHRMKQGKAAMGVRLPFDIELREKHKPGPLLVAAAFDADAKVIAQKLRTGTLKASKKIKLFRLTLVSK